MTPSDELQEGYERYRDSELKARFDRAVATGGAGAFRELLEELESGVHGFGGIQDWFRSRCLEALGRRDEAAEILMRLAASDDRFLAVTASAILEADERMTDRKPSKSLQRALVGQIRVQLRIVEHVAASPFERAFAQFALAWSLAYARISGVPLQPKLAQRCLDSLDVPDEILDGMSQFAVTEPTVVIGRAIEYAREALGGTTHDHGKDA